MNTATKQKSDQSRDQSYEEWKDEQIRLGLEDVEAGRVISHEEFMRQSDAHLKRLTKKHGKAA